MREWFLQMLNESALTSRGNPALHMRPSRTLSRAIPNLSWISHATAEPSQFNQSSLQKAKWTIPDPNGEVGYLPVRQNSSSTTGESGGKTTSISDIAAAARAFASLLSLKLDTPIISRRDHMLFDLWSLASCLRSGMLSSVMEMAGFSFIMGTGGGAYVGGGGGAETFCCGIVGGARVGIRGGALLVSGVVFCVFALHCCGM